MSELLQVQLSDAEVSGAHDEPTEISWIPWRTRVRTNAWAFFRDLPHAFPYLRPYWKLEVVSLVFVCISALLGILAPWPLALLLDSVIGSDKLPHVLQPILGGVGRHWLLAIVVTGGLLLSASQNAATIVYEYVTSKLDASMVLDFRSDLFGHAQKLPLTYFASRPKSLLVYRLNNQADSVGQIIVSLTPLLQSFLMLAGMFYIACRLDLELALVALGVVPFIYYSAGYYARRIQPRLVNVAGLEVRSMSVIHEAVSMIRVIVAFGRERHEHGRYRKQAEEAVGARIRLTVTQTIFALGVNMITAVGTALVLGLGALHVLDHRLTTGDLVVMLGYVAAIYNPLEQISYNVSSLQQHFTGFHGALQLLAMEPGIAESPDAVEIDEGALPKRGAVSFENVSFKYGDVEALRGVSAEITPGQLVAVVGPTGAGKTTLISLLLRFYDPTDGVVRVDGIDLRELSIASLRKQMTVVLQEPQLFSGTIAENIRYGHLDADDDAIVAAATSANAHDFISRMPDGYNTIVGDGGAQLSGGERQRVCVARAFLKDAPILILDEPTSSIDLRTESVILDALDRLSMGRTTFVIAHRLSTLRHADVILVLDQGCLVERGTHDELLALDGLYKKLHDLQSAERPRRVLASAYEESPEVDESGSESAAAAATLALLGAVLASEQARTLAPLEELAHQRLDPDSDLRLAGQLAGAILAELADHPVEGDSDDGAEVIRLVHSTTARLANGLGATLVSAAATPARAEAGLEAALE